MKSSSLHAQEQTEQQDKTDAQLTVVETDSASWSSDEEELEASAAVLELEAEVQRLHEQVMTGGPSWRSLPLLHTLCTDSHVKSDLATAMITLSSLY